MLNQQLVLLNGLGTEDKDLVPLLDILIDEIHSTGATVQTYTLQNIKMGSCVGCFGCWLKTPGICLEPDVGRDIAQAVVQSDTTILLTPVTFGGYSSEIKKIQDRWLPLLLPYFGIYHGEVHHPPRYSRNPRLVGIGIQRQSNNEEANLFKILVGRNAINLHSPNHAAAVVLSTDVPERLRQQFQDAFVRNDAIPLGKSLTSLIPVLETSSSSSPTMGKSGRALLIVGSPKVKSLSTSSILGGYVLEQLKQRDWEVESITLRENLLKGEGQAEFLASVQRADLLLLAFPLYVDALPFLMTKALEVIAANISSQPHGIPKRLFVICNNGFPEAHHNAVALAICQRFAVDTSMIWSGGLAMGAGEVLCGGLPLKSVQRGGRPPVQHVIKALDKASAALAEWKTVPSEATRLMAKTPIPFMPFSIWRWIFVKMAQQYWQKQAATNQVSKEEILARPYTEVETTDTPVR